jgi:(4S)-4-hydroxy-5-phosphonooxypentane-2,3-dione isomerase
VTYALVVKLKIRDMYREEFLVLLGRNVRTSLEEEPGCLSFDVRESTSTPNAFLYYEVYQDEAAFNQHINLPRVAEHLQKTAPMLDGEVAYDGWFDVSLP